MTEFSLSLSVSLSLTLSLPFTTLHYSFTNPVAKRIIYISSSIHILFYSKIFLEVTDLIHQGLEELGIRSITLLDDSQFVSGARSNSR